jgi:hypothetical protein
MGISNSSKTLEKKINKNNSKKLKIQEEAKLKRRKLTLRNPKTTLRNPETIPPKS